MVYDSKDHGILRGLSGKTIYQKENTKFVTLNAESCFILFFLYFFVLCNLYFFFGFFLEGGTLPVLFIWSPFGLCLLDI